MKATELTITVIPVIDWSDVLESVPSDQLMEELKRREEESPTKTLPAEN